MYKFQELETGPIFKTVKSGFTRLSQGEAFAYDWFKSHGYDIVDLYRDTDNDAIDFMTAKAGNLYQFAVEKDVAAMNAENQLKHFRG